MADPHIITALEYLAAALDGIAPGNRNVHYARISLQKAKEEIDPTAALGERVSALEARPVPPHPDPEPSTAALSTPPASEAVEHE